MNLSERKRYFNSSEPVVCPGVYDALSATLAAEAGFPALYLSGASIAYTLLGQPDIGLVTMSETLNTLAHIAERVDRPIVVDADTGFGNALNVQRSTRLFERAGAAVMQLEDQTFPKRCGHLTEKKLVPSGEMVGKIKAALDARSDMLVMARTDAIAVEGFDAAMERAERYLEAGADILFIEAPETNAQMKAVCERFSARVPLLANMVEGGRTPFLPTTELGRLGYKVVIFPGGTVRALIQSMTTYFQSLREHGTTAPFSDRMLDFRGLQKVLGTEAILARGRRYDSGGMKAD